MLELTVLILENLKNIDNILEQYKTDPKLQEIRDYLQRKKDVTVEWDLAINESVAAIKKRAQEATPNLLIIRMLNMIPT